MTGKDVTVRARILLFMAAGVVLFLYRSTRRLVLRRSLTSLLFVVLTILAGVTIVIYGKLWHINIKPVPAMPGTSSAR